MDQDVEVFLDQVRAERAELKESMAAVEQWLSAPAGESDQWRTRLRAALGELAHDFDDHIELTEREGFFRPALSRAPRLTYAVSALLAEHPRMREDIDGYLHALDHGEAVTGQPAFRDELKALLARLAQHRRKGWDLIHEAFAVDIGGQD